MVLLIVGFAIIERQVDRWGRVAVFILNDMLTAFRVMDQSPHLLFLQNYGGHAVRIKFVQHTSSAVHTYLQ